MAFFQCQFFSEALQISTAMNVILPQQKEQDKLFPVLYLLHGLSDDHTAWCRQTSIERYAMARGLAVVMPAVNRSFYANMSHGAKYWTFISEELPELARSFFPLSPLKEHNYVAGLSMGGYGAMKLALSFPDRFAAAASLSGAVDVARLSTENVFEDISNIFSEPSALPGSRDDLFALAQEAAGRNSLPRLFQCCGTEDFLYQDNTRYRDHCLELGLPLTYEEGPGNHEWGYWDRNIERVIDWFGC
jgi:putative tributyrin esterase